MTNTQTPEAKATTKAPNPPTGVRYFHNGKPVSNAQNRLSSVAWHYTKGISPTGKASPSHERLSAKEFYALLSKLGIKDPKSAPWKVTLPNETVIEAKFDTSVPVKAPRASSKASKSSSTKNVDRVEAKKAEAKAAREAKAAGQPVPPTPLCDEDNAKLAADEAARKAAHVAKLARDKSNVTTMPKSNGTASKSAKAPANVA